MRKIVLDIETCGCAFDDLSETQQEYLLRYAEKEKDEEERASKTEEVMRYLSLYPFTAKVISLAMLDVASEKTVSYFEGPRKEEWENEEKKTKYHEASEQEIIEVFWRVITKTDQLITFNGRSFDIPFLMLRSAILRIKPTRNLNASRFDIRHHIDLLEQFTLHGLVRKFNLDFYCRAFGIASPKTMELNGMEIRNYYEAGRNREIALYCANEVNAIYGLYKIWSEYLDLPLQ